MLRLLIVDDEQIIADSLSLILGHLGCETTAVYSGAKAVEVASVLMPDVVILDILMAEMNGIGAGIQIRQAIPTCRVILFSGHPSAADLVQRATSEGNRFELLTKPIYPEELLTHLTGGVCGYERRSENRPHCAVLPPDSGPSGSVSVPRES
jgi:CheY-like chemotaxis protein